MRRLRRTRQLRELVRETALSPGDLIYPAFVKEGTRKDEPIESMPGQARLALGNVVDMGEELLSLGVPAVMLFGVPAHKDDIGSGARGADGIVQRAVAKLKREYGDQLLVMTDVCLCQYTDHGHCGLVSDGKVLNDETLVALGEMAVSHAMAGADMVAPSAMMDGQVRAIREALDDAGANDTAIMAYSTKFASSFYGPFREAADSRPSFGDRRTHQMDPGNSDEAVREALLDAEEGADILMVKPALPYLDLVHRVKDATGMPLAAYSVSGEYAAVKAAGMNGWINEREVTLETLTAIRRAGADMVITYSAKEAARWLQES